MRKWLAVLVLVVIAAPFAAAADPGFYGPLRARDLTPFGYLRLDMRPGFSQHMEPGRWSFETDFAYQNTWATSPEVEKYLNSLDGRRVLGAQEWQAIQDLPGENYLVDLELAQVDLTVNYQISQRWGAYAIVSGAGVGGGFLDSTIESFHSLIDAPRFGRPAAARSRMNLLFDLKSGQYSELDASSRAGFLDPVLGVRYTSRAMSDEWQLTLESAVKVPVANRRKALSTGRTDFGLQMSAQRTWNRDAVYVNMSAVYYAGMNNFVPEPSQIIPTFIAGYERRLTPRTNLILQGYVSRSVYERQQTELSELTGSKIQLSGGIHHRRGAQLFTFALTENIGNINNTPDVGFQFGWSFHPGWR